MSHTCPTCGGAMDLEWQRNEGICTTIEEHLEEAKRLANADPVCPPEEFNAVFTTNLLGSIAHSLVVIAERIEFDE